MSRRTGRKKRLTLYNRGNTACALCLRPFSAADVEQARATLEDVPPRSLRRWTRPVQMCLTCKPCNSSAGETIDQDAARIVAQMEHPHSVAVENAVWEARLVPPNDVLDTRAIQAGYALNAGTFVAQPRVLPYQATTTGVVTKARPAFKERSFDLSILRAAYLSVFSLLGPFGYRFASGSATQRIRAQILRPTENIVEPSFFLPSDWPSDPARGGIRLNRGGGLPCWGVLVGEVLVLLPRSWDESFFTAAPLLDRSRMTFVDGPVWWPARFHTTPVATARFAEGFDPNDLFGKIGWTVDGGVPFIAADYDGDDVTVLFIDNMRGAPV